MTLSSLFDSWWLLAFLVLMSYALVASTMTTLSAHYRGAIVLHDRMRESRQMRRRYAEDLKARQEAQQQ